MKGDLLAVPGNEIRDSCGQFNYTVHASASFFVKYSEGNQYLFIVQNYWKLAFSVPCKVHSMIWNKTEKGFTEKNKHLNNRKSD